MLDIRITSARFCAHSLSIFVSTHNYHFRQSVKKFEKLKRDLDKTQTDYALLAKERNDSVSQLSKEMKEIERLEAERVELFSRIDSYERSKTERKENIEVTKGRADMTITARSKECILCANSQHTSSPNFFRGVLGRK